MKNGVKEIPSEEKIDDFDGVSLYPSAMDRLGHMILGKPVAYYGKEKSGFDIETDPRVKAYFVRVKILSVGIKLRFPLQSVKDENGVRNYTNDLVGKILHMGHIALQDLIEFQKVKYQILDGYYFTQLSKEPVLSDAIKKLFDMRLKYKKEKNQPAQQVMKLMMNSAYGKTILKFSKFRSVIVYQKDFEEFVGKNIYEYDSAVQQESGKFWIVKL